MQSGAAAASAAGEQTGASAPQHDDLRADILAGPAPLPVEQTLLSATWSAGEQTGVSAPQHEELRADTLAGPAPLPVEQTLLSATPGSRQECLLHSMRSVE